LFPGSKVIHTSRRPSVESGENNNERESRQKSGGEEQRSLKMVRKRGVSEVGEPGKKASEG